MTGRKLSILPEILAYPNWRHRVHLGNGLYTMGYNTIENDWEFYGMPEHVAGKTVLDLGANDGYYSFKAEEKGAAEVTAMDIYWGDGSTMVDGWPLQGITLLKTYLNSNVVIKPESVYDLHQSQRQWDVVFCNDLLSWLEDIPRAMDQIAVVCKEKLIIHDTFSIRKNGEDVEIKQLGIAKLHRMRIDYLVQCLRKRGFRKVSIHRVYSFKHYIWQFENFPPATAHNAIEIWDSPIEGKVIKTAVVQDVWVLQTFREFVYLREIGWAKKSDLRIANRYRSFWLRQLKKCIPYWLIDMWHRRIGHEKNIGEFVITAER